MKQMRTHRTLAPILLLALLLTACADNALRTTAKSLDDTQRAVATLQNTVIAANAQGLVSRDATASILGVCQRINNAVIQSAKVTRNYTTLPADAHLTQLLGPVLVAVQQSITDDSIVNLKDKNVKDTILLSLGIIQTALQTTQAALGGK